MKPRRVASHLGALRRLITRPADLWMLARMLAWSAFLPILKRTVPLPRLVSLMQVAPRGDTRDPIREAKVADLAAWVFKSRPRSGRDNCLERSLVAYRFLGRLNAQPELVVGLASGDCGVVGHAWTVVDGQPVHDSPLALEPYASLIVFGSDGGRSESRVRNEGR
jgi:hypothetical protein